MPAKQGIPLAFNLAILARPILVHFGFYHLVQINQGDGIGKRSVWVWGCTGSGWIGCAGADEEAWFEG
jgi:hypothetical protein